MLKSSFTHKGQPDEDLAPLASSLLQAMKIPSHLRQGYTDLGMPSSEHYFILPSSFKLLEWLKRSKRKFSIVFKNIWRRNAQILSHSKNADLARVMSVCCW